MRDPIEHCLSAAVIVVLTAPSIAAGGDPPPPTGGGNPPTAVLVQPLEDPTPGRGELLGLYTTIDGDFAAVAAPGFGGAQGTSGEVIVYGRSGGGDWTLDQTLSLPATPGVLFGRGLALDGERLAVGVGTGNETRVHRYDGAAWVLEQAIPGSGATVGPGIDLEDDLLAVGESSDQVPDTVRIFRRTGTTWNLEDTLHVADEEFGTAVAVAGDVLVVGAPGADDFGEDSGAAYVYERIGGSWGLSARLVDSVGGVIWESFGGAVETDGQTVLVGAPEDDSARGSVFVFERQGAAWVRAAKLSDPTLESRRFGGTVSMDGDRLVAGAAGTADLTGVFFVFEREEGVWVQRLVVPGAVDGGYFGRVSLSGDEVLVGAPGEDDPNNGGAAYAVRIAEASAFCFGDGSGAACPCANESPTPGDGCLHSGSRGMRISGLGSTSRAADDLTVTASQCPPGNTGLFYAGTVALDPPVTLYDGLQCVGGDVRRFRGLYQESGVVTDGGFVDQDPSGVFFVPGGTYHWQYWSRDVASGPSPCGSSANLSPGYAVTISP